jgi:hypothetical protein
MLEHDHRIAHIMYDDVVEKHAKIYNVSLKEARTAILGMSFRNYMALLEANADIVPPSGSTVGPGAAATPQSGNQQGNQQGKQALSWKGQGTPIQQGMIVGLKGKGGLPMPGNIKTIDNAKNVVTVTDPTTGMETTHNINDLQPFMANSSSPQQQPQVPQMEDEHDLARMKHLAGIREECSGGATGAGGIASAPTSMGGMQRRQPTTERLKKEYTPKRATTVVGDTKPSQASGQLSATLAANNKPTASRKNAGIRK